MPVCYGNMVTLSVPQTANASYLWLPGGFTTPTIIVKATQNISYSVKVTQSTPFEECQSAPFDIVVHPRVVTTFQQLQKTCTNGDNDNGNTAMVRATATGSSGPYAYNWIVPPIQIAPGNPSMAIGLKARLWYFIDVVDQNSCIKRDSVFTKAFSNPKVKITATPDTAYIQNPEVKLEFKNLSSDSVQVLSHFWMFGDNSQRSSLLTPVHLYNEVGKYAVSLTVFNQQGCDTVYSKEVKVMPVKLKIPNIITPNGDNINDVLIITEAPSESQPSNNLKSLSAANKFKPLSVYYKRTNLVIFNRQGRKVYESDNYNNDWAGDGLKDGVYFYVLQCEGFKSNEVYKGSITIMGSQN